MFIQCLCQGMLRVRGVYSLLGEDRKKKRYSRSDGEKSYGEKLRRIRASLGGCSGVWGGGNSIL